MERESGQKGGRREIDRQRVAAHGAREWTEGRTERERDRESQHMERESGQKGGRREIDRQRVAAHGAREWTEGRTERDR